MMGKATLYTKQFILVLALNSIAKAKPSGTSAEVVRPKESLPECDPGEREDVVHPDNITHLNFDGASSVCQSQKCLGSDIMNCKVTGWTDSGNSHVECHTDHLPRGFEFVYTNVRCVFEEGCIVVNSCRVEYKLEKSPNHDRQHRMTYGSHVFVLIIICVLFWHCGCDRGYGSGFATGGLLGYGFGGGFGSGAVNCGDEAGGFTSGVGHGTLVAG